MKPNIQYIFLFLLVVFYGCESYYVPEIEVYPDALVVEGMLTDQNDYAKVQLTKSVTFNNSSYFYAEKKATVTIESETGKSYSTVEIGKGIYQTKEQVKTQVGEGYFVKIITSAGEEYRSKIEKMMSSTPIDSIYLTDSLFKDISYNYWGEMVVKDYGGITFSVKPHEPDGEDVGFLYKWNALVDYYVYCSSGMSGLSYYCWKQIESSQIHVYDYINNEYVNELPIGDIHSLLFEKLGPLPIDSSRFDLPITSITSTSFYYHLRQYTVTRDGVKFWRSVKNQSEASGKLFDPVEEQIVGNIYCVSDSSKVAFGYFNTTAFSDKVIKVKLTSDSHKNEESIQLMPMVDSEEDCFLNSVPDFWY